MTRSTPARLYQLRSEEHHLAGGRQVLAVSLEVPLRLLSLSGRAQGHHSTDAGVEALDDALDDAALAGGIASLEDDHDLEAPLPDEFLHQHQLPL
jgi:hypothetical protein